MALFPHVSFTRLLGSFNQEDLRSYAGALASAFATWENADALASSLPDRLIRGWLRPPLGDEKADQQRIVDCRIGKYPARHWCLMFHADILPYIAGSLFIDDQGESDDWRGYGDHLILNTIADSCCNVGDPDHTRGFPSSIYLVRKLQSVAAHVVPASDESRVLRIAASVEEALSSSSLGSEIFALQEKRKDVHRFLSLCDEELMERLGPAGFSRLLEPLGVTLKRWRKVRR